MYQILVTVTCVIFIIGINGSSLKLSTSISDDANELAPLVEEYWSLQPAALFNSRPLAICRFIKECCGTEERLKAIPLMFSSTWYVAAMNFPDVIKTCTDSTAVDKTDKSCPSLEKFSAIPLFDELNDPAVVQARALVENHEEYILAKAVFHETQNICNNYELHALLCLTDKKLIKTCVGKTLQKIHDSIGNKKYSELIIQIKQDFIDINRQLIKISVDNTNTN